MRAIINDMLFLARADQGERATGLVDTSLAAEVAHTLEFLEIPLEEAHVRAVSTGDALVRVNKSLFGRACINLLMNAIQHCAQGSIIKVSITREGDQVRVAVANPGEPIESAVLDHLFDRFYRAEVSRTNSRENHGLGLAIVKATAEMHGGKVSVTSVGGHQYLCVFGRCVRQRAGECAWNAGRQCAGRFARPVCAVRCTDASGLGKSLRLTLVARLARRLARRGAALSGNNSLHWLFPC
jgi:signal transduction histidine kinase